jgi:SNF2 family DNA or RNA helicase
MKFKPFQIEQIARAALVDGALGNWEPGLGKMIFALAWPMIKRANRCLIVAPGQLHRQFRLEAMDKFGLHLTRLRHHGQIKKFGLHLPPLTRHVAQRKTRFFLTNYHDLGQNNRCGGTVPPLAQFLADLAENGAGFDCVVIDEGTKIQANMAFIAIGVRILQPKYRLALTGTPIKNRLESIFWLLWWVAGAIPKAHNLFPYTGTPEARELFANQHLMTELEAA